MRTLLSLLFVLAFAVRSIVPVGVMLAHTPLGDGGIKVVICTGQGPLTVKLDADGKPTSPKPFHSTHAMCEFAASAPIALAAAASAVPLPRSSESQGSSPPFAELSLAYKRSSLPPARGPPSVS